MRLIKGIGNLPEKLEKPVLTMGIFDGVHLAHQKIIKEVVRRAKGLKGTSVVLTFDPHPFKIFEQYGSAPLITSVEHRIDLIRRLNTDVCLLLDFNKRLSKMRAQDFIKRILIDAIGINYLIVGPDFRFGKSRSGSFSLLKKFSKSCGFKIRKADSLKVDGRIVSSSKIRRFIQKGKIGEANKFLGRTFSILGEVKKGSARGRILGYPTANIQPEQEIIPCYGVYAVFVKLNSKTFPGILNIGVRPTFGPQKAPVHTIEVHIFNFHKQIYGKNLEVFFIRRIRSEKRFSSQSALLAQIKEDEIKAKRILKAKRSFCFTLL